MEAYLLNEEVGVGWGKGASPGPYVTHDIIALALGSENQIFNSADTK